MASDLWIFDGDTSSSVTDKYCAYATSLFLDTDLKPELLRYHSTLGRALRETTSTNFKLKEYLVYG